MPETKNTKQLLFGLGVLLIVATTMMRPTANLQGVLTGYTRCAELDATHSYCKEFEYVPSEKSPSESVEALDVVMTLEEN